MNDTVSEREEQWLAFLKRWPLESLESMSLAQYSQAGNQDCFVYWLEAQTESLGSIWGGSAFKFGIYSRKDKTEKPHEGDRYYAPDYAWYAKYGDSADQAFDRVKAIIVNVANAARDGQLDLVEQADLGPAVKWKLAFLYQNRETPCILPIYKAEYLRVILKNKEKRVDQLQRQLSARLPKPEITGEAPKNLFTFADEIWAQVQEHIKTTLSSSDTKSYFDELERFAPIKPPTQKIAGYQTNEGAQLALALDNQKTTLYLRPGDWQKEVKGLQDIVPYAAHKPRSSNIDANAPKLALGHPMIKVVVPDMATLIALCDAYEELEPTSSGSRVSVMPRPLSTPPLNQILYGPPGTGKTYASIDATLEILDPEFLSTHAGDRAALKGRFDALAAAGHLHFVTFHQSFSYEDFVEGLRAENDENGQLRYEVSNGVFKSLCDAAAAKIAMQAGPPLNADTSRSVVNRKVLIIDEINRGNVSRIFGELITLIEPSKRSGADEALEVMLPYSKERFSIPTNLYLIGTMNTADRSLAGLDIALRRRFAFREMPPRPDLLSGISVDGINIGEMLAIMNERIEVLLDRDHCLGHAYFMPLIKRSSIEELGQIFRLNIIPLLQEYFFEDWQRIQWVLNDHRKSEAYQFISKRMINVATLFGEGVSVNEQGSVWGINAEAFTLKEAYQGIINPLEAAAE